MNDHESITPSAATKNGATKNDAENSENSGAERLQKLMARAGIASRRAAEEMIADGKVSVNGHVITEAGFKADPQHDRILVEGRPLQISAAPATVILLHKPRGVMTTKSDPEKRATVFDLLPRKYASLHTVGRLDYDTTGLLLLTDDGDLTQLLTHPSHGVTKTYHARVRGTVKLATIKKLEQGIMLEDGPTAPCKVRLKAQTEKHALLEITIHEGRNRQVRRMLEAVGHPASSLRRVGFAQLDLQGVTSGKYRELLPGEVHALRKMAAKGNAKKPSAEMAARPLKSRRAPANLARNKAKTNGAPTSAPAKETKKPAPPVSSSQYSSRGKPRRNETPSNEPRKEKARASNKDKAASPLAGRIARQWKD